MDAKSQAKSKRAHSQHLNKKHQTNPKAKAAVAATRVQGIANKASGKQIGQKSRQVHGLPSNWDRYEEELDEGSEDRSLDSTAAPASDVVVRKSKGADFSYLISEARSQSSSSVEYFTSLQDTLPEFDQAVSSMLSVRREGILSWIADDNFILDDNVTAGCEASFLSMDLHALAEQLEKLDISQRLFIEDLLPPELCSGGNNTVIDESEQPEMLASGNNRESSDESAFYGHNDLDKNVDLKIENISGTATNSYDSFQRHPYKGAELVDQQRKDMFSTINSNNSVPTFTSQPTQPVDPVKGDSKQLDDTALGAILDSIEQLKDVPVEDSAEKTLKFEALAAEAELDMLLNSFGGSNLFPSSGISKHPTSTFPLAPKEDSKSSMGGFTTAATMSSKTVPVKVNLNDTIDDLHDSMNQNNELMLQAGTTISSGLPSLSVSSNPDPKGLHDFESWLDTI